jgi:ABC-2 type transport system ATP-binding protein
MIDIDNLTKTFKRRIPKNRGKYENITALDHINLKINNGEILGLIGPNGAGKTTTAKILSTLILPDEGRALIDGLDVVKDANFVKKKIGLVPSEYYRSLYWRLSGMQNLRFFAKIKGMRNAQNTINELIERFNLQKQKDELVMKYSTGMKNKLALAVALLADPSTLFLDEPLTGIDPITAYEIKKYIKNEFKEKTIIWTSHNLYEIEEMCDRIAIITNGKILTEGKPEELKKNYRNYTKIVVISDKPDEFTFFEDIKIQENAVEIKTNTINYTISEIMALAKTRNIEIFDIKTVKPSLEEIFIEGVKNA